MLKSEQLVVRPRFEWWTPLSNTRVWVILLAVALVQPVFIYRSAKDSNVVLAVGLIVITIDCLISVLSIGFNRCVVKDGWLLLQKYPWHRTVEKHEILGSTGIKVDKVQNGWFLETFSAAYPSFANVRVVPRASKTSGIYMLAKTDRQIARLQEALDRALDFEKRRLRLLSD